jgi:hypothetical protein
MARSRNTADTQTASGGPVSPNIAGKNKIINGDFSINQRNFSSTTSLVYTFDRWYAVMVGGTVTWSAQTFTPGTAPVAGYEGANFIQVVTSGQTGTNYALLEQRIENVRTLAGETATISFWAKAGSGTPKIRPYFYQDFGTGGSPSALASFQGTDITISTSWERYSQTISIPALTGKTIGTTANTSNLRVQLEVSDGSTLGIQNGTFQIWGVQLEEGPIATPFQTATGTIQGELAACQRYYFRTQTGTNEPYMGVTVAGSSTTTYANIIMKQTMRTTPSSVDFSAIKWQAINNSGNITAASISGATPENVLLVCTTTGATAGAMNYLMGQTSSGYVGFSAEL